MTHNNQRDMNPDLRSSAGVGLEAGDEAAAGAAAQRRLRVAPRNGPVQALRHLVQQEVRPVDDDVRQQPPNDPCQMHPSSQHHHSSA